MTPVLEWRIHLGAHKTATTHLQETLALCGDALRRQGVDFITRPVFRPVLLEKRVRHRILRWRTPEHTFVRAVKALRTGPNRVLISEEEILGFPEHLLFCTLYPDFWRVFLIAALTRDVPTRLFLSIRSQDSILPSAYCETLRWAVAGRAADRLAVMRRELAVRPPRWSDLVSRLQTAMPHASIHVWRLEDYARDRLGVVQWLSGCRLEALPEVVTPSETVSPSRRGVEEAEALPADLDLLSRRAAVAATFARHPAIDAASRFQPLAADEITRLREAYEADIDAIGRMPAVELYTS